jgi:galactokinase
MLGIKDRFKELFGQEPLLVEAPGRINLIGEHTDYNEGFVLPAAIDKTIVFGFAANGRENCRLYSVDMEEHFEFDVESFTPQRGGWANYIMGMVAQFQENGLQINGFDCVFGGNIPVGAGLSSSAALLCGTGLGLAKLFGHEPTKLQLIKMAQKAEHVFAGVQCGIMDQFASTMGKRDHVIRLDCQSLDFEYFKLDLRDYEILLCDTQVKHALADTEYNTRRQECETGINVIRNKHPHVQSLRDVDMEMLQSMEPRLDPIIFKRCLYVVEENQRVVDSCLLLLENDLKGFGEKMYGSHKGLSDLYEVSCPELDVLVEATQSMPFVLGSRMMGGGFGGCTINLVRKSKRAQFEQELRDVFMKKFDLDLPIYEVRIEDGVRVVE